MTYRKCNGSVSRRKFLKGLAASGATSAVGIASAARIHGVGKAWRAGHYQVHHIYTGRSVILTSILTRLKTL